MSTTPKRADDAPNTDPEKPGDNEELLDDDQLVDEQGEESFPASDSPSNY